MAECSYSINREINGVMHQLLLTQDEISAIWRYYDDFLMEEHIENRLRDNYGITDYAECADIISDMIHRYNKSRGYGCDEEYSLDSAFEEMQERIKAYMKNVGTVEG